LAEQLLPFLQYLLLFRFARFRDPRKILDPIVRPARINDCPRAKEFPCALRIYGVEGARVGVAQQIDVFLRIRLGSDGQNNTREVRRIDIVVPHDNKTTEMAGGRLALRGQVGSLSSVPWEALLY